MPAFIDANIVLRYLTGDPPEQSRRAAQILDLDEELLLTDGTIAEVAYVLMGQYAIPRDAVVNELIRLLRKQNITTYGLDDHVAIQCLLFCRPSGRVSFADALLWAVARSSGHRTVYTFDERFPGTGIDVRR